jgi:hypothetical protein
MGSERELLQTGDSAVSKPVNILTNQLLNNENVPLLYQNSNRDAQRTVDEQFPQVQLYSARTENYNQYGQTEKDKVDNSIPKPENTTAKPENTVALRTDLWGGDDKATQNRKKPMAVEIQPDGSATVEVKAGDTVWDIAKRMLQEQNRKAGKPEPTNKEVYEKMKEIEKLNGGNCTIIRPGQKIKIADADVAATQKARGETHVVDDGKGNTTITRADGSSVKVEAGADAKPVKVTETDANGKQSVYVRGENGEWKDENGKTVKVDVNKDYISITDESGKERRLNKDGSTDTITKSGNETHTVHKNEKGETTKIIREANGKKVVYEKVNGEWTRDGQCVTPEEFSVEEKDGKITIADKTNGNITVNNDGTVTVEKNSEQPNTTSSALPWSYYLWVLWQTLPKGPGMPF